MLVRIRRRVKKRNLEELISFDNWVDIEDKEDLGMGIGMILSFLFRELGVWWGYWEK